MVTFDQPKIMYQKKEGEESYIRTLKVIMMTMMMHVLCCFVAMVTYR